jgi:hypothetical protein
MMKRQSLFSLHTILQFLPILLLVNPLDRAARIAVLQLLSTFAVCLLPHRFSVLVCRTLEIMLTSFMRTMQWSICSMVAFFYHLVHRDIDEFTINRDS